MIQQHFNPIVYLEATDTAMQQYVRDILAVFPAVEFIQSQSEFENHAQRSFTLEFSSDCCIFSLPDSSATVIVDYAKLFYTRNLATNSLRSELLVKAVYGRQSKHARLSVVDATAGLGRDAFILGVAGCDVIAIERNPILSTTVQYALRCAAHSEHAAIANAAKRIQCYSADSIQFLTSGNYQRPDVIYLDPMYDGAAPGERGAIDLDKPDTGSEKRASKSKGLKKTAAIKKEAQLLQLANTLFLAQDRFFKKRVGNPNDIELIACAREVATKKVVVKRALYAPFLGAIAPSSSIAGKAVRFDIYAC